MAVRRTTGWRRMGESYDTDRTMYLRNNLTHAQRAVVEGWPLRGYFCWSLLDNFEWNDGYTKRFGVFYVNFETQKRVPNGNFAAARS
jgi:beta-glucosidase